MDVRKLPRLDLEAIVPIPSPRGLDHVARYRQGSRLPLFENVAILVQHEPRVLEKVGGAPIQIDTTPARRSVVAPMQAREQRVLDDPHVTDALAEDSLERRVYSLRHRDGASDFHGTEDFHAASMIYTIGHSKHPIERFVALLQRHGVDALADVRSTPYSRFNPQFNREKLQASLAAAGIRYVFLGEELGARSKDASCYDEEGRVSYAKLARTVPFRAGIERLLTGMQQHRIAIMCAEREPLDCHRTILVSRELEKAGVPVNHILQDGSLEPHRQTMSRLASDLKLASTDLFRTPDELIEDAYEKQGSRIAYVRPPPK
jgi:hypothetical protein